MNVKGSQELKLLLENNEQYVEVDLLTKVFEGHDIMESTFSLDKRFDYGLLTNRSFRILNRISSLVKS